MRVRGFTLIELLVVIAIIAILAALTAPVFNRVKSNALHANCVTNMKQLGIATNIYASDYDDGLMPAQYRSDNDLTPTYDRRWPQLLLPYARNFRIFRCPSDAFKHSEPALNDPSSGMRDADVLAYRWAERTNYGYNALNLSPGVFQGTEWYVTPLQTTAVANPSATILFAESVWEAFKGRPMGGGNYIVLPPCRFTSESGTLGDTLGAITPVYNQSASRPGWTLDSNDRRLTYGGVWAWHNGSLNQTMLDGSVVRRSLAQVTVGCDMKPNWQGRIVDRGTYLWDTN